MGLVYIIITSLSFHIKRFRCDLWRLPVRSHSSALDRPRVNVTCKYLSRPQSYKRDSVQKTVIVPLTDMRRPCVCLYSDICCNQRYYKCQRDYEWVFFFLTFAAEPGRLTVLLTLGERNPGHVPPSSPNQPQLEVFASHLPASLLLLHFSLFYGAASCIPATRAE